MALFAGRFRPGIHRIPLTRKKHDPVLEAEVLIICREIGVQVAVMRFIDNQRYFILNDIQFIQRRNTLTA